MLIGMLCVVGRVCSHHTTSSLFCCVCLFVLHHTASSCSCSCSCLCSCSCEACTETCLCAQSAWARARVRATRARAPTRPRVGATRVGATRARAPAHPRVRMHACAAGIRVRAGDGRRAVTRVSRPCGRTQWGLKYLLTLIMNRIISVQQLIQMTILRILQMIIQYIRIHAEHSPRVSSPSRPGGRCGPARTGCLLLL